LRSLGKKHLIHANSVITAKTFCEAFRLLSRGAVESEGMFQTDQYTDSLDKRSGIWHDLFLNLSNQHRRFCRPNTYGPVSFSFSIDILLNFFGRVQGAKISITKIPPSDWEKPAYAGEQKWVTSLQDLAAQFDAPRRGENFFREKKGRWPDVVISGIDGIPLNLCQTIEIETLPHDPAFFSKAKRALLETSNGTKLLSKIQPLACNKINCGCKDPESFKKPELYIINANELHQGPDKAAVSE